MTLFTREILVIATSALRKGKLKTVSPLMVAKAFRIMMQDQQFPQIRLTKRKQAEQYEPRMRGRLILDSDDEDGEDNDEAVARAFGLSPPGKNTATQSQVVNRGKGKISRGNSVQGKSVQGKGVRGKGKGKGKSVQGKGNKGQNGRSIQASVSGKSQMFQKTATAKRQKRKKKRLENASKRGGAQGGFTRAQLSRYLAGQQVIDKRSKKQMSKQQVMRMITQLSRRNKNGLFVLHVAPKTFAKHLRTVVIPMLLKDPRVNPAVKAKIRTFRITENALRLLQEIVEKFTSHVLNQSKDWMLAGKRSTLMPRDMINALKMRDVGHTVSTSKNTLRIRGSVIDRKDHDIYIRSIK
jgi:histone H3/H4